MAFPTSIKSDWFFNGSGLGFWNKKTKATNCLGFQNIFFALS
jgi:hypothetical protein